MTLLFGRCFTYQKNVAVPDSIKKTKLLTPVDYDNLDNEGLFHGLNYPRILSIVDGIIGWDYFYLDGRGPSTSEDVAKFFTTRYDPDKIIFSVGLWGKKTIVSPEELSNAIHYELRGGARHIWITPNHLISNGHWEKITQNVLTK